MKKTILFVDDNHTLTGYYVRALEKKGFSVNHVKTIDNAWKIIQQTDFKVSMLILDIMMQPGDRYAKKDTHEGLRTGALLFDDLKMIHPEVPVVVLTNLSTEQIPANLQNVPNLPVLQKLNTTPIEFADLLQKALKDEASKNIKPVLESTINDS